MTNLISLLDAAIFMTPVMLAFGMLSHQASKLVRSHQARRLA